MISFNDWISGPKDFPRAWEDFLSTEAGQKGLEVLASRMISEKRVPAQDSRVIETTAISGAEDNGYRSCYTNISQLCLSFTEAVKERREKLQEQSPLGATRPDIKKKIEGDPIIAEHKRRQNIT